MACCPHSEKSDPKRGIRGHDKLTHEKNSHGHCLACCRDAVADLRHWSYGHEDTRPLEVRIMHLHEYSADGPEVPGIALLQLDPKWLAWRDKAVEEAVE